MLFRSKDKNKLHDDLETKIINLLDEAQDAIKVQKDKLNDLQKQFAGKTNNKFSKDEAKEIWKYAKKYYLDNGVSYSDMISFVATDLGLSWRQVAEAIVTPKTEKISDEMWKKRHDLMKNKQATTNWIAGQSKSWFGKAYKEFTGLFRGIAVFGHGGIFVGTHAGMNLFSYKSFVPTIKAFVNGWK